MKLIAKTLYGLEKVLAKELMDLGASDIVAANRAVIFEGDLKMLYSANYMLRSAISVLWQVSEFSIRSADDLYNRAKSIEWDRLMDVNSTFSIVPVVQSPHFNHTGFAALKLKDSIADYFRKKTGTRPSVDNTDPDILINLHISNNRVTISLDSSKDPLFKRGYRKEVTEAPLNEVLAAGMLLLSGWNARCDLIDPMCGSGTIPIEAGMMACRIPPGKFRNEFGFQKWKNYDGPLFETVKDNHDSFIIYNPGIEITGLDISSQAVICTRSNLSYVGLDDVVKAREMDFRNFRPDDGQKGYIFINPPYGERLSKGETDAIYGMVGTVLKHNCHGFTAWLISSNKESMKYIGLKPSEKHTLYNGSLECLFARYELYQGSRKEGKH